MVTFLMAIQLKVEVLELSMPISNTPLASTSAARFIVPAMPYLLSFAAGAMMYVVVEGWSHNQMDILREV